MTGGRRGSRLSIEPAMINKTNLRNTEHDLMTSNFERNLRAEELAAELNPLRSRCCAMAAWPGWPTRAGTDYPRGNPSGYHSDGELILVCRRRPHRSSRSTNTQ